MGRELTGFQEEFMIEIEPVPQFCKRDRAYFGRDEEKHVWPK